MSEKSESTKSENQEKDFLRKEIFFCKKSCFLQKKLFVFFLKKIFLKISFVAKEMQKCEKNEKIYVFFCNFGKDIFFFGVFCGLFAFWTILACYKAPLLKGDLHKAALYKGNLRKEIFFLQKRDFCKKKKTCEKNVKK